MALIKEIEHQSGAFSTFHRIRSFAVDRSTKQAVVGIASYVSAEAYAAGKSALCERVVEWNPDNWPFSDEELGDASLGMLPTLYAKLKGHASFEGAEDAPSPKVKKGLKG